MKYAKNDFVLTNGVWELNDFGQFNYKAPRCFVWVGG
jgi:hypothetical protein